MKYKSFIQLYYPAILVLIALLSFTIYAWQEAVQDYEMRSNKLFEERSHRVAELIDTRMGDYAQILRGCRALFDASGKVTREEWKIYVSSLNVTQNYPGIQGLAVSRYLPVQDSLAFLKELRKINSRYSITSQFEHPVITPVLFIEPFNKRNERAMGFDLYSEVHRREAIERAINTGKPSITRKIKLRQETSTDIQPGFLMFLPVFTDAGQSKVLGFVANVFRTHDLMDTLLNGHTDLDIQLYDGVQPTRDHLIYERLIDNSTGIKGKMLMDTTLIVGGLPWRLTVQPNRNFGSPIERRQSVLVLAIGLVLTLLLFVVSYNNIRRKLRIAKELEKSHALERKKDEFISIASHELKTPLTSIKASVQIMERADLKEREKFMLQKARKNIDKLQNLIGDLLDISKIQAGQLQLNKEYFKLADLIHDCIDSITHLYPSHKIEVLQTIPDVSCYGDKFRLEQAINNLLINAAKYSPGKEKIYIEAGVSQSIIKVAIIDEGIGISKPNLTKIFGRFFRAEELSPVISGLGIGLHISNEIVKQHNGRIKVKSEINQGSIFTIELPLVEEPNG